jgi:hypothetical protein
MNSIVIYLVLITTIMIGFALIIYFTYDQGWLDSILNEFMKPEKKDKDKIEEEDAEKDEFGIRAIYPSPTSTLQEQDQIWYAKWDDGLKRILSKEQKDPLDSSFRLGSAGTPKVTINGNGTATVNGSSPRIYVFGKWTNVEITVYVMYSSPDQLDSISIHGRSNHHKDCGFGGYTVRFGGFGDDDGGISWIKKEPLHGIYSDRMGSVDYSIPVNKWVGLKAIVRNINDGGNKVSVEGYVDNITTGRTHDGSYIGGGNGGQWKKILNAIDNGTWPGMGQEKEDKEIIKECIGKGDNLLPSDIHKPFTKPTEAVWLRTNGAEDVKYKWFSVREIKVR